MQSGFIPQFKYTYVCTSIIGDSSERSQANPRHLSNTRGNACTLVSSISYIKYMLIVIASVAVHLGADYHQRSTPMTVLIAQSYTLLLAQHSILSQPQNFIRSPALNICIVTSVCAGCKSTLGRHMRSPCSTGGHQDIADEKWGEEHGVFDELRLAGEP